MLGIPGRLNPEFAGREVLFHYSYVREDPEQ
jgi:hypothetical protein